MKKKTLSNIIMAAAVALIIGGGIFAALRFVQEGSAGLGSAFQRADVPLGELDPADAALTCTVAIECRSILDNLEDLAGEKVPYVPEDGVILPETRVAFSPGETAFDVLKRVCEAYELQTEYSYTPLYDSYYIESIAHLYEFDCGPQSGWLYTVDGRFPNYGCSAHTLTEETRIVYTYSCGGLGKDAATP